MSGKIIKVSVNIGDTIQEDDEVAVLEAMKMEMPIIAEKNGIITEIKVVPGQTVEAEQPIIIMK